VNNTHPQDSSPAEREPGRPQLMSYDSDDGQTPGRSGAGLGEYLRAVYRHRWLGLATLLLVTAPIIAWAWWQEPVYESRVSLVLDAEPQSPLPFQDAARAQAAPDLFETQQEMLRSRQMALRTISALRLWEHREFRQAGDAPAPVPQPSADDTAAPVDELAPTATAPDSRSAMGEVAVDPRAEPLVGLFLSRVRTASVPLTRVVNVWFEASDPQLAADVANALADGFIAQDLETRFETVRQSAQWLEARLTEQRLKVEQSEAALQLYKEQPDASAVGNPQNIVSQGLSDLNTAVMRARAERLLKEAAQRQLEAAQDGQGLDAIPAIASSVVVQQLRAQEGELERQAAELSKRYGERHPEMVKVQTALEQTRQRQRAEVAKVGEVVRNEYQAALANERSLTAALESQKGASLRLSRQELEYGRLQREAETNRQLYDTIMQQARQLGITSELKQTAVRVLDRAQVPTMPIRPDKVTVVALALAIGLLAAVGVVFGREYLDSRLKTPEDVRRYLRLPFIGLIPAVDAAKDESGPAFVPASHLGFSEALRRIRTYLLLLQPRPGVQTLLVTSTGPQEGKSTVSVGLAKSLAAAGSRVLLVDADLRRPSVHRVLGLERKPGLADFLASTSGIAQVVRPTETPFLSVVTAGSHMDAAPEMLGLPVFAGMLASQEDAFDWIVIDSPPVLSVSDASLLAKLATGVLFVVGAEMAPRASAQRAVEQLMAVKAQFAGAVLNRAAVHRHSHYYAPYYSKKYESYYAQTRQE
jgi:polysaccharide biosynthesis transport protein